MCAPTERRFSYRPLASLVPRATDLSKSVNLVDGLLRVVLKKYFWEWLHHVAFIMQRPTPYQNFVFTDHGDHILIKACNLSLDEVTDICRRTLPDSRVKFKVITAPSTLCGVYQWLLLPLGPRRDDKEGLVEWPVLHLPIKENIDYYKLVHPRQIILRQVRD